MAGVDGARQQHNNQTKRQETEIYLDTKVEEASFLVPTELGKGVESLLDQDSKPNRQVVPFTPICVNSSYWQQDGAKASGFKVSFVIWRLP